MKRWQLFVPLILFLGLSALLYVGLFRDRTDALPSPLLNKPLPEFTLATIETPERVVTVEELKGKVALLNVWATWCISCKVEHPFLMTLANQGIPVYGVNYKDDRDKAIKWLQALGDPYLFSINDSDGTLGVNLGVYGAPETYLIDADGIIRYKHTGIVNDNVWNNDLKPRYEQLLHEQHGGRSL
ncbi:DsbE family thiol:disulfide interchange protein [Candidatus Sororendozoicomonas aggregata]|uniref:DsbE family thiol:disulfide interchange protein n=1 Tax=Candidatus Sororendozoicomonas aggregata TaxID=3073239 RepID=UPI002ED3395E